MKISTNRVNRIIIFILALVLMVPGDIVIHKDNAVPALAAVNEVLATVVVSELNVRTSPEVNGEANKAYVNGKSVLLTYGQRVTVIGKTDDWYHLRVVFDGEVVEGYSKACGDDKSDKWIVLDEDLVDSTWGRGMVNAQRLNVRTGPSTDYAVAEYEGENVVLDYGKTMDILAEENGWYHVSLEWQDTVITGYCINTYIDITIPMGSEVIAYAGTGEELADTKPAPPKPGEDKPKPGEDKPAPTEAPKATEAPKPTNAPTATPTPTPTEAPRVIVLPFDTNPDEVEIPQGYYLSEAVFESRFQLRGTTVSDALSVYESPSIYGDVIAELDNGTEVIVIDSELTSERDENKKVVKHRWYKIVVYAEEGFMSGYVTENDVELDYTETVAGVFIYNDTVLKIKPGSSTNVKDENDEKVTFPAGCPIEIIEETVSKSGVKRYLISAEKDGVIYTGYQNSQYFHFAPGETELYVYELYFGHRPSGGTFEGANATVKDGYGVPLHTGPQFTSATYVTSAKVPVLLYSGDPVEITDVEIDDDIIWCYVKTYFDGAVYYGYIRSAYLDTDSELVLMSSDMLAGSTSMDFEAKLATQGFPESYKEKLRALHEQYPLWEFKAYHTGIDWEYAIESESGIGDNLIENDEVGVEWKSLEAGAYSWKTDTFTVFDGATWVTVSEAGLRYYMDPRNFLDSDTIFQFEVLNFSPSYQTIDGVEHVLKNTAMSEREYTYTDELGVSRTATYAETIMMAAEYSGVSPFHLASRIKQEITLGANSLSNSVSGTVSGYEGLYNFYNIGATHSTENLGAIKNGLRFAQNGSSNSELNLSCLIPWNSGYRAIVGGAYYIGRNYINKGQNTIYLQKFNVTDTNSFWHQYMANVRAPYSEGRRLLDAYENPKDINIVFLIPVYLNMPEEATPAPKKQYNPNNWLKTLKIYDENDNKLTLTPSFDYTVDQQYDMIVDGDVEKIKVKTTTVSSLAEVTSKKTFKLDVGKNRIVIKVKAENGDVRKYIINVVREEPVAEEPPVVEEPELTDTGESTDTGDTALTEDGSTTGDGSMAEDGSATGDGSTTEEGSATGDGSMPEDGSATRDGSTTEEGSATGDGSIAGDGSTAADENVAGDGSTSEQEHDVEGTQTSDGVIYYDE